jgi:ArsR family transcriptional regulator
MNPETILAGTASLFLALGDKTRLRLLNLMRDREVCVSSFTGILEQSQPLVSRHLAYLRNSGIVEARRDGKWIHYTISTQLDENSSRLLTELFKWMESQDGLRIDREKYSALTGEPMSTPRTSERKPRQKRASRTTKRQPAMQPMLIEDREDGVSVETDPEIYEQPEPPSYEEEPYRIVRHNELEDFLL